MFAGTVNQEVAMQNARQFLNEKGKSRLKLSVPDCRQNGTRSQDASSTDLIYVFNIGDRQGFVIVSSEEGADPILGYSFCGSFDVDDMPPGFLSFLQRYTDGIKFRQEHSIAPLQRGGTRTDDRLSVGPMLKTKWHQREPYNNDLPSINGSKVLTGCVATAMAQIMYYHQHPTGSTSAIPGYTSPNGLVMEDLAPTTFDWANMALSYNNSNTPAQKAAVAHLMKYCVTAVKADLGLDATGAYLPTYYWRAYFGYGNGVREKYSHLFDSDTWEEIIYKEVANGRPVLSAGGPGTGRHAYVVDGYDNSNGMFSVNWGWGGSYDGFYRLTAMTPGPYRYDVDDAVIGISPQDIEQYTEDSEVVLSTEMLNVGNSNRFYMYGNQCNISFEAKHVSRLNGIYDIDYNYAIYKNGVFVEHYYSEDNVQTYSEMEYGNYIGYTQNLYVPAYDSKHLGELFVEPGIYKMIPESREHGKMEWKENIGSDQLFLSIVACGDQSLTLYVGDPPVEVTDEQRSELSETFAGLLTQAKELQETIDANTGQIDAANNGIEDAEKLVETMEGLVNSIKNTLNQNDQLTVEERNAFFKRLNPLESELDDDDYDLGFIAFDLKDAKTENEQLKIDIQDIMHSIIIWNDNVCNLTTTASYDISCAKAEDIQSQMEALDLASVTDVIVKAQTLLNGMAELYEKLKALELEVLGLPAHVTIPIGQSGEATFYSEYNLDFSGKESVKAYVATGYDKATATIWLSRAYKVPAKTGILLMGDADEHEITVVASGDTYYKNMFKGTLEGTTLQTTDGAYTNYYLSKGAEGVGFYKVTKEGGVALGKNRAYLPIPTVIEAVGEAGSSVAISVGGAGQVPYYSDQSLDFTEMADKGMKAYTATGYDYSTGTIWLSRVKQVPAETGVLIMAPKGDYEVPTASVASVYENMFKGTLDGTTILTEEDGFINYYLSNGAEGVGFYKVTKVGGVALGANRCYLQIPKVNPSAASRGTEASQVTSDLNSYGIGTSDVIGIPLFGSRGSNGEGTTNIRESVIATESEVYYNLQGQRVDNPSKGLYIRNGKKIVFK
jgi:hypothetical protein